MLVLGGTKFVGTQLNSDLVHEFALTSGFWDITVWTYVPGSASPNPMGDSQWLVLLNNYSYDLGSATVDVQRVDVPGQPVVRVTPSSQGSRGLVWTPPAVSAPGRRSARG